MNALFNHIKSDKILLYGFSLSAACIALSILMILFALPKLPNLIPLYNQLPWGESRLGKKIEFLIPLFLSIGIFILNTQLSIRFYSKLPLLSRFLAATSFIASFLILAFAARTIQLVL